MFLITTHIKILNISTPQKAPWALSQSIPSPSEVTTVLTSAIVGRLVLTDLTFTLEMEPYSMYPLCLSLPINSMRSSRLCKCLSTKTRQQWKSFLDFRIFLRGVNWLGMGQQMAEWKKHKSLDSMGVGFSCEEATCQLCILRISFPELQSSSLQNEDSTTAYFTELLV